DNRLPGLRPYRDQPRPQKSNAGNTSEYRGGRHYTTEGSGAPMRRSTAGAYLDPILFEVISQRSRGKDCFQGLGGRQTLDRAVQAGPFGDLARMLVLEVQPGARLTGGPLQKIS